MSSGKKEKGVTETKGWASLCCTVAAHLPPAVAAALPSLCREACPPLGELPHLLLLSLFLLFELIQHSLQTGLQRQKHRTTILKTLCERLLVLQTVQ